MKRNVFGFRTSACNLYSHAFGKLAASIFKLLCLLCKENKQMLVTLNVTYKELKSLQYGSQLCSCNDFNCSLVRYYP